VPEDSRQAGAIGNDALLAAALFDVLGESKPGGHVQGNPLVETESIVDGYFDLRAVAASFIEVARRRGLL
jgi:hypothetical protein